MTHMSTFKAILKLQGVDHYLELLPSQKSHSYMDTTVTCKMLKMPFCLVQKNIVVCEHERERERERSAVCV